MRDLGVRERKWLREKKEREKSFELWKMSVVYSYEAKDKKIRRKIKTFWLNLVLTTKLMSIRVLGIYSRSTIIIFY
jgi:Mg2+/citrate symporter